MKKLCLVILFFVPFLLMPVERAYAGCINPGYGGCSLCGCPGLLNGCQNHCLCVSDTETGSASKPETTMGHITEEFKKQRKWLVDQFFKEPNAKDGLGVLAAFKILTSQLTAIGMLQVEAIGAFFDAKHQLETQRLFQQMTAEAHKDYHPSEELCEVASLSYSLSSSSRKKDLTRAAISKRSTDRQLLAKDTIGMQAATSDKRSRLNQFILKYCDKNDNRKNLDLLCMRSENKRELFNKDINFSATIGIPLTLDLDFNNAASQTADTEALFAMTANLFAHELPPQMIEEKYMTSDNKPNYQGAAVAYMDWRSLAAKRSVAANSIASIAGLKTKGSEEVQPFIYALIQQMSKGDEELSADDIKKMIGENPSYYAQMEVLTKKLYQNPTFYSNLYDKPANVLRKDVAIQAATLMQKRDLFHSLLRSEMLMAVMLETALIDEQLRIDNEFNPGRQGIPANPRE
jgi:hypothetical protein